jgi:hypothetical protein
LISVIGEFLLPQAVQPRSHAWYFGLFAGLVKAGQGVDLLNASQIVIPAKAGIQNRRNVAPWTRLSPG